MDETREKVDKRVFELKVKNVMIRGRIPGLQPLQAVFWERKARAQ